MPQYDFGLINPATTTGGDLASMLESWRDAVHSNHLGTTRPSYIRQGQIWVNTTNPTSWSINFFDGVNDIVLGTINPVADSAGFSVSSASITAAGIVQLSTPAEFRANSADRALSNANVWSAAAPVALSWANGATTGVDLSLGLNFSVTTGSGNSTLGNPVNAKPGQSGFIAITQGGTARTLAFGTAWKFANGGVDPSLTATANALDILFYQVINATGPVVYASLVQNVS